MCTTPDPQQTPHPSKTGHPSPPNRRVALGAWLVLIDVLRLAPATAQTGEAAYRCLVGPRTVYQSTPCAGGQAVEVADPRSEAQRAQSEAQTERLGRVADHLAASNTQRDRRLAAEAALQRPTVIVSKTSAPKNPPARRATSRRRTVTIRSASRGSGAAQATR